MTSTATGAAVTPQDLFRIRTVSEPQASPDGRFIAYTVTQADEKENRYRAAIWLVAAGGSEPRRLTSGEHRDSSPRWSPDGGAIAFISDRDPDEKGKGQVWTIPTEGGEPERLTSLDRPVEEFAWSPSGTQIALVSKARVGPERPDSDVKVITRIRFRFDGEGFLDDGGAFDGVGGGHRLAIPDRDVAPGAALEGAARALPRRAGGGRRVAGLGLVEQPGGDGAQGHDFHRIAGIGAGEALAVHGVEGLDQRGEVAGLGRADLAPGHQQFEGLAVVAHVGGDGDAAALGRDAVLRQARIGLGAQRGQGFADARQARRLRAHDARARDVLREVREQDSMGRECTGFAREGDLRHALLPRHPGRVQPARATEGEQAEVARVEPLLEQRQPDRRAEVGVGDGEDALRRGLVAALLATPCIARAQAPRPIRLIAPFPPGGGVDLTARLLADPLSRELGQTIVVENRGAAGGMIGVEAMSRAAPDGLTLSLTGAGIITAGPHLRPLHAAMVKVMRDPANVRRFDEAGRHPAVMELDDCAAFLRADSARWEGVVRRGNIRIDG
mgnify:CR=1 FL=1